MTTAATTRRRPSVPGQQSAPESAPPVASPSAGAEASREARRLAAAVLEVLAGTQSPAEASHALGISVARYYQLEGRALAGLVAGCESRRGRGKPGGSELASLRRECERLRRECGRQQALVRAARKAAGLAEPPTPPEPAPSADDWPRRRRRPKVRALRMAAQLRASPGGEATPASGPANQAIGSAGEHPAPAQTPT
jgi:hypothetical protein